MVLGDSAVVVATTGSCFHMNELRDLLARLVGILDRMRVPYMVVGSLAGAHHGVPRPPQDVDFVVQLTTRSLQALLDRLDAEHAVPFEAAQAALKARESFFAEDRKTGLRADFLFQRPRLFSREEFARRQRIALLGVETWVASAEDTILGKLEWAVHKDTERQIADVRAILEARRLDLDILHIERWITELGLIDLWESADRARPNQRTG